MKILIPSDNRDFVGELAAAYAQAGCEVVTGTFNFELGSANFDLVHFQWPEELSEWKPPSEIRLQQITDRIAWWNDRCPTLVTVHNLYPHGHEGDEACKKLYNNFYSLCSYLLHFSSASKQVICNEFVGAQHDRHIVTTPWNFERALDSQKKRGACREEFGFANDDFIILVMGALRSWDEIQLVSKAFSSCRVKKKKLLMAGRYQGRENRLKRKWRQTLWKLWLWHQGAAVEEGYIPDEELSRFLDTADVVLVPRLRGLNSGIPGLAMTFGRMVIAPSHGPFPEYLAGTGNIIYESGNPLDLARAIDEAAGLDRKKIEAENRHKAAAWTWNGIVRDCFLVLGERPRLSPIETSAR